MTQNTQIIDNEHDPVIIFTDGACRTDLRIGGWGVLLTRGNLDPFPKTGEHLLRLGSV